MHNIKTHHSIVAILAIAFLFYKQYSDTHHHVYHKIEPKPEIIKYENQAKSERVMDCLVDYSEAVQMRQFMIDLVNIYCNDPSRLKISKYRVQISEVEMWVANGFGRFDSQNEIKFTKDERALLWKIYQDEVKFRTDNLRLK